MSVKYLYPKTPDDNSSWTTNNGAADYACIDDDVSAIDDDTTYVESGVSFADTGYWPCTDWDVEGEPTIDKVEVVVRARIYSPTEPHNTGSSVTPFVRIGTSNSNGDALTPGLTYETGTTEVSRPGGGTWSYDDMDSLSVGMFATGGGKGSDLIRITALHVKVTYSAAAEGGGGSSSAKHGPDGVGHKHGPGSTRYKHGPA